MGMKLLSAWDLMSQIISSRNEELTMKQIDLIRDYYYLIKFRDEAFYIGKFISVKANADGKSHYKFNIVGGSGKGTGHVFKTFASIQRVANISRNNIIKCYGPSIDDLIQGDANETE